MSAIHGRIKKLYRHKKKWARKNQIDSYRLYDRDIPDFPFIVDCHGPYCVIYRREIDRIDEKKNHLPLLIDALINECEYSEKNIVIKERKVQDETFQYTKESTHQDLVFNSKEGEIQFKLILNRYIDTGLFLDHRPLRQKLANEQLEDKNVLNLFCYTGSLSVASAHAGAIVTSVDMSNTYLNWAEDNFKLNDIDPNKHKFIREDVLKYLAHNAQKILKEEEKYDLIILDPPSMSKSKKMEKLFDIQSDHVELINNCAKLLKKDGTLYFSNNLRSFKLDESVQESFDVKDLTKWSIPQDFHDAKIHKLYKINLHC
ncbi:Met-10+ like-protein [Halobacteriovorax sp. BALOs_7]|uniref:class I SAM-dependent methyltransferase n=1 Tax=Halobacteriovorax sp. BALOs_7 TaxID=2109558 RepID=UPI000EA3BFAC|nr:class I SAM-dependent methyltransferase [Halobacteriovorax sp. BALOs_7]AYF44641.1 Met-10+ like-protein [Halobacteriovorax sp. BALOs_7]